MFTVNLPPKKVFCTFVVMLVTVLALSPTGAGAQTTLFHLDFDEADFEAVVAGGDGTPTNENTPVLVSGIDGYGGRFDEGDALRYLAEDNIDTAQGAISMWIKMPCDAFGAPGENRNLFREDPVDITALTTYTLFLVGEQALRFHTSALDAEEEAISYLSTYAASKWRKDEWHHIVFNWDSSNNNIPVWAYMDGQPDCYAMGGSGQRSFTEREWTTDANNPAFFIGAFNAAGSKNWEGIIDEVKIFDSPLTDAQALSEFVNFGTRKVMVKTLDPYLYQNTTETLRLVFDNQTASSVQITPTYEVTDSGESVVDSGSLSTLNIAAGASNSTTLDLQLSSLGEHLLEIEFQNNGTQIRLIDLRGLASTETCGTSLDLTLVDTVDAVTAGTGERVDEGGASTIVYWDEGDYREVDDDRFDRMALKFEVNTTGTAHLVRVRYPDDKARSMEIIYNPLDVKDAFKHVQLGFLTGDEYPVTNTMIEQEFVFWPRSTEGALIFHTVQSGMPAAVEEFKVYKINSGFPSPTINNEFSGTVPARQVGFFYEDPAMHKTFGENADFPHFETVIDRLLDMLEWMGQGVLSYPVAWYRGPTYRHSDIEPASPIPSARPHPNDFVPYMIKRCHARGIKFIAQIQIHDLPSIVKDGVVNDISDVIAGTETVLSVNNTNTLNLGVSHKDDSSYNPLDTNVVSAVNDVVDEILERYGDYPGFNGMVMFLNPNKLFTFGSASSGYNDINRTNFENDTSNVSPVSTTSSTRFGDWYTWLQANCWTAWLNWRCGEIHDQIEAIADKISAVNSNYKLYLHLQPNDYESLADYLNDPTALETVYQEAGIDLSLFESDTNIVCCFVGKNILARGMVAQGQATESEAKDARTLCIAPEISKKLKDLPTQGARYQDRYWEVGLNLEDEYNPKKPYPMDLTSLYSGAKEITARCSTLNPRQYHYLEFNAAAMNNLDPVFFNRGGFQFSINGMQDYVLPFAKAVRTLPAVTFDDVATSDPIRVRQKTVDSTNYFYVLNRCPSNAKITLNFSDTPTITDLVADQEIETSGSYTVVLSPYELKTYSGGTVTGATGDAQNTFEDFCEDFLDDVDDYFNTYGGPTEQYQPYYSNAQSLENNGDYGRMYCLLQERWNPITQDWDGAKLPDEGPAEVSNLNATPGDEQIGLTWTNPSDSDLTGIRIQRSTTGFPTGPTNGTNVYDALGTSYTDTGLSNGTMYYYKAFTYDFVPNYSDGTGVGEMPGSSGSAEFNPSDDAYVKETAPTTNYGSETELRVRYNTSGRYLYSYLKFTVSGISGSVTSAKLKLYSNDVAMNVDANAVSNITWNEDTITWNNKPAMGSTLDTVAVGTAEWVEFDVSTHITGNGTFSIGLEGDVNEAARDFDSKEGTNAPVLIVSYGGGDTTAPANPTGLAATPGDSQVTLDWNDNTEGDLDGYNVYRSTTTGSGYSKINGALISESAYTDSTVTNNTTYYYVVTAVDTSSNESGYSTEDSAYPQDTTAPANPTGLAATAGNGEVSLDWNNNTEGDLDGYNVYRSTTTGSGYSKLNGALVSTSDYTDATASNGTTYYYVVTAVDTSSNESGYSNEDSATPSGGGTLPFNPTDDAYVRENYPTNNYNDAELRVRAHETKDIYSYLKFAVTGISGSVTAATLKLYSVDVGMGVDANAVSSNAWSESTVTWSNKPAMGSTLDTVSVGSAEWVEFDVTSHITGNGTFTLGLVGDTNATARNFDSSEGTNVPVLEVTYE